MPLTNEQVEYFDKMENLFLHPGWKTFVEDLANNRKALVEGAFGFETEKSFNIAKGRVQAYDQVINFESFLEEMKKRLMEDDETDA